MSLPENRFDYSTLDSVTADFLKSKEISMSKIVGQAYTEIGRELSEAREALAQHGYGCFEEWYTTLGFKKDQVYRWIGRHELIVANCEKRELIEQLPVSLAYELSRPSANPDAVKAVLDGEIHTHKEFKELEKSLKAAEKAAAESEQRAQQAEAERARAIQQHTKQQEKLQAHIAELEIRKTMSLEDKEKLQKLTEENISLNRSIEQIREEYDAKVNKLENDRHAVRKLKESFKNILVTINFEHSQAEYYLLDLMGLKEAHEAIKNFVDRFDEEVLPRIEQWRRVTEAKIEQGGSEDVKPSNSARSRVIIDVDPSEESAD